LEFIYLFTQLNISTIYCSSASSSRTLIAVPQRNVKLDNIYNSDFVQESLSPTSCHASSWLPFSVNVQSRFDRSLCGLIAHKMFVQLHLPFKLI
jgi:hypothetical protein